MLRNGMQSSLRFTMGILTVGAFLGASPAAAQPTEATTLSSGGLAPEVRCPVDEFVGTVRSLRDAGYKVSFAEPNSLNLGEYDADTKTIDMAANADVATLYGVLIHEMTHAAHQNDALDLFVRDWSQTENFYGMGFSLHEIPAWLAGLQSTSHIGDHKINQQIVRQLFTRAITQLESFQRILDPQVQALVAASHDTWIGDTQIMLIPDMPSAALGIQAGTAESQWITLRESYATRAEAVAAFAVKIPRAIAELSKWKGAVDAFSGTSSAPAVRFACNGTELQAGQFADVFDVGYWQVLAEETEEQLADQFWVNWMRPANAALVSERWRDWILLEEADPVAGSELYVPTSGSAASQLALDAWWWPPGTDCSIMYCGPQLTWDHIFAFTSGEPIVPSDLLWDTTIWGEQGPFFVGPMANDELTFEQLSLLWAQAPDDPNVGN